MTKPIFALALLLAALTLAGCGGSDAPDAANAIPGAPQGAQPAAGKTTTVPSGPAMQGGPTTPGAPR